MNTSSRLLDQPEQSLEPDVCRSSFLQDRETMKTQTSYLGIDVSKRTLHLANVEKLIGEFENGPTGYQKIIKIVKASDYVHIVLEASGGYERAACEAFQAAGLTVVVAQPGCVRHFAKSIKVLAKTDAIDAKVIARFGQATKPSPTPPTPENIKKLRALTDRRTQVVEDRVRESNRLELCVEKTIVKQINASIKRLLKIEKELDLAIKALLEEDTEFCRKASVLMQQKGVGEKTACALLSHLPELGSLTRQQVAALAGLAPHARESGSWKGKRSIYGGRAAVRKAMYMAARVAMRWCPVISLFYKRLRENGKPFKVAIIACARKMITRLNTQIKHLNKNENDSNAALAT